MIICLGWSRRSGWSVGARLTTARGESIDRVYFLLFTRALSIRGC